MKTGGSCEYCAHNVYDEELEMQVCEIDLDEDETERFLSGSFEACPYFSNGDEYTIVRKQN